MPDVCMISDNAVQLCSYLTVIEQTSSGRHAQPCNGHCRLVRLCVAHLSLIYSEF
jgi:hypothetical protein